MRMTGGEGVLEGLLDRIRAATGGRVLVVDDDEVVRDFVGAALRAEGYAVAAAPDAGAALDLLWAAWEDQPDVILLDLLLPAVDGRGFTGLYRELPVRHAPIVLMSAQDELERVAAETGPRPASANRSTWTSCSRRWRGTSASTRAGPGRRIDRGRRWPSLADRAHCVAGRPSASCRLSPIRSGRWRRRRPARHARRWSPGARPLLIGRWRRPGRPEVTLSSAAGSQPVPRSDPLPDSGVRPP